MVSRLAAGAASAGVLVAILASLSGCSASGAAFDVTGYAESGATSTAQVVASAGPMTELGVDGVNLTPTADGISAPDASTLRLLADAHARHLTASLLFGNFSSRLQDFSDPLAERMFRSPAHIRSVVAALVREVHRHHWDGITVDLESLNGFGAPGHTRDDNAGLDSFVHQLRAALGSHALSICVSATTGSYASLGYDLKTLGGEVDHIVLMAYDQHGPAWSKAGPVGGYPWVSQTVRGLLRSVAPSKIQLGVGEYGYSWPTKGEGTNYSVTAIRALVSRDGVAPHWDARQREWHARLRDGTVLWWSDARSFATRENLARSLQLGGVAVWSLGQGDPL